MTSVSYLVYENNVPKNSSYRVGNFSFHIHRINSCVTDCNVQRASNLNKNEVDENLITLKIAPLSVFRPEGSP